MNKGEKGGECNRTACSSPNAVWYNKSTRKYYCGKCARTINELNVMPEKGDICSLEEEPKE